MRSEDPGEGGRDCRRALPRAARDHEDRVRLLVGARRRQDDHLEVDLPALPRLAVLGDGEGPAPGLSRGIRQLAGGELERRGATRYGGEGEEQGRQDVRTYV